MGTHDSSSSAMNDASSGSRRPRGRLGWGQGLAKRGLTKPSEPKPVMSEADEPVSPAVKREETASPVGTPRVSTSDPTAETSSQPSAQDAPTDAMAPSLCVPSDSRLDASVAAVPADESAVGSSQMICGSAASTSSTLQAAAPASPLAATANNVATAVASQPLSVEQAAAATEIDGLPPSDLTARPHVGCPGYKIPSVPSSSSIPLVIGTATPTAASRTSSADVAGGAIRDTSQSGSEKGDKAEEKPLSRTSSADERAMKMEANETKAGAEGCQEQDKPLETREAILLKIDELESAIEAQEQKIEAAEGRRAAALEAEQARLQSRPSRRVSSPKMVVPPAVGNANGTDTDCREAREGSEVYILNAQKAEQARAVFLEMSGQAAEDQEELGRAILLDELECYRTNLNRETQMRGKLLPIVQQRAREIAFNTSQLRHKYLELQRVWDASLSRRERDRDNRLARKLEAHKEKGEEQRAAAVEGSAGGRASSRSAGAGAFGSSRRDRSIGSFDVVRSEEEMNAVLAQLAAEEKREKSDLWIATQCARDTPMILEPMRSLLVRFETRNGFVEDAVGEERERKKRCVWTEREKKIFVDKWMGYPKNFRKIKSFLEWKSVSDCVNFYYINKHKLDLKRGLRAQQSRRGRGGYQSSTKPANASQAKPATSQKVHDEAAYVVNPFRQGMRARPRNICYRESALGDAAAGVEGPASNVGAGNANDEPPAPVSAPAAVPPAAPAVTANAPPASLPPAVLAAAAALGAATPAVTPAPAAEKPAGSGGLTVAGTTNRWTDAERARLVDGVDTHGLTRWELVSGVVKTKTATQCRNYYANYRERLPSRKPSEEKKGADAPTAVAAVGTVAQSGSKRAMDETAKAGSKEGKSASKKAKSSKKAGAAIGALAAPASAADAPTSDEVRQTVSSTFTQPGTFINPVAPVPPAANMQVAPPPVMASVSSAPTAVLPVASTLASTPVSASASVTQMAPEQFPTPQVAPRAAATPVAASPHSNPPIPPQLNPVLAAAVAPRAAPTPVTAPAPMHFPSSGPATAMPPVLAMSAPMQPAMGQHGALVSSIPGVSPGMQSQVQAQLLAAQLASLPILVHAVSHPTASCSQCTCSTSAAFEAIPLSMALYDRDREPTEGVAMTVRESGATGAFTTAGSVERVPVDAPGVQLERGMATPAQAAETNMGRTLLQTSATSGQSQLVTCHPSLAGPPALLPSIPALNAPSLDPCVVRGAPAPVEQPSKGASQGKNDAALGEEFVKAGTLDRRNQVEHSLSDVHISAEASRLSGGEGSSEPVVANDMVASPAQGHLGGFVVKPTDASVAAAGEAATPMNASVTEEGATLTDSSAIEMGGGVNPDEASAIGEEPTHTKASATAMGEGATPTEASAAAMGEGSAPVKSSISVIGEVAKMDEMALPTIADRAEPSEAAAISMGARTTSLEAPACAIGEGATSLTPSSTAIGEAATSNEASVTATKEAASTEASDSAMREAASTEASDSAMREAASAEASVTATEVAASMKASDAATEEPSIPMETSVTVLGEGSSTDRGVPHAAQADAEQAGETPSVNAHLETDMSQRREQTSTAPGAEAAEAVASASTSLDEVSAPQGCESTKEYLGAALKPENNTGVSPSSPGGEQERTHAAGLAECASVGSYGIAGRRAEQLDPEGDEDAAVEDVDNERDEKGDEDAVVEDVDNERDENASSVSMHADEARATELAADSPAVAGALNLPRSTAGEEMPRVEGCKGITLRSNQGTPASELAERPAAHTDTDAVEEEGSPLNADAVDGRAVEHIAADAAEGKANTSAMNAEELRRAAQSTDDVLQEVGDARSDPDAVEGTPPLGQLRGSSPQEALQDSEFGQPDESILRRGIEAVEHKTSETPSVEVGNNFLDVQSHSLGTDMGADEVSDADAEEEEELHGSMSIMMRSEPVERAALQLAPDTTASRAPPSPEAQAEEGHRVCEDAEGPLEHIEVDQESPSEAALCTAESNVRQRINPIEEAGMDATGEAPRSFGLELRVHSPGDEAHEASPAEPRMGGAPMSAASGLHEAGLEEREMQGIAAQVVQTESNTQEPLDSGALGSSQPPEFVHEYDGLGTAAMSVTRDPEMESTAVQALSGSAWREHGHEQASQAAMHVMHADVGSLDMKASPLQQGMEVDEAESESSSEAAYR
ncbi:MAG: hypothetical protein SGPRY_000052 [Prymnesium sp.]